MRMVRDVSGAKAHRAYSLWDLLGSSEALCALRPRSAFTTNQLEALVTPDVFEVIDWPTFSASTRRRFARARRDLLRSDVLQIVLEF